MVSQALRRKSIADCTKNHVWRAVCTCTRGHCLLAFQNPRHRQLGLQGFRKKSPMRPHASYSRKADCADRDFAPTTPNSNQPRNCKAGARQHWLRQPTGARAAWQVGARQRQSTQRQHRGALPINSQDLHKLRECFWSDVSDSCLSLEGDWECFVLAV